MERTDSHQTDARGQQSLQDAFGQVRTMEAKHLPRRSREGQAAEQGSGGACFWIWFPIWSFACPCPSWPWWDVAHAALSPPLPQHTAYSIPKAGVIGGPVLAAA